MSEKLITIEEAAEVLQTRGAAMDPNWLRKKCRDGGIPGAVKIGGPRRGVWLIPLEWARSYTKVKSGRPRRDETT